MSTLDDLVRRLQQRYGARAARRGDQLPAPGAPMVIPTGYAALDAVLPGGGLPRGAVTELVGPCSSGIMTLALSVIARAQRETGDLACLLDLGGDFAPVGAASLGVDLESLAVARPDDGRQAALTVHTLVARRAVGVLVVDSLPQWLALPGGSAALARLLRPLPQLLPDSGCALLFLNLLPTGLLSDPAAAPVRTLASVAALRLRCAHAGWVRRGPTIVGAAVQVTVVRPLLVEAEVRVELVFG